MRFLLLNLLLCLASGTGWAQQKVSPAPKIKPAAPSSTQSALSQSNMTTQPVKNSPGAIIGKSVSGSAQDYQNNNSMLKVDPDKISRFQGKMFQANDLSLKKFNTEQQFKTPKLNSMFNQTSSFAPEKNKWEGKKDNAIKLSSLNGQAISLENQRAKLTGTDVPIKQAKGFDGKPEDAKRVGDFGQMLGDGQKKYGGPESPEVATERELIQQRLKKMDNPEDVKRNQLSSDEVRTLLQPQQPLTRPK